MADLKSLCIDGDCSTVPSYTAGSGIGITNGVINNTAPGVQYTAGQNIQINNNEISATDTTYTAGSGISIQNGEISNTAQGVTYTAGANVSITNNEISATNTMRDPATANPLMDGTAAVGSSMKYAREDHRHPTDTTRASRDNPWLRWGIVSNDDPSQFPRVEVRQAGAAPYKGVGAVYYDANGTPTFYDLITHEGKSGLMTPEQREKLDALGTVYTNYVTSKAVTSNNIDSFTQFTTVSVPKGTYIVIGRISFSGASSNPNNSRGIDARIAVSGQQTTPISFERVYTANSYFCSLACSGVYTASGQTTLALYGSTTNPFPADNNQARITAIRIA